MDEQWLTADRFAGREGETFSVSDESSSVETTLTRVRRSDQWGGLGPDGEERRQFSLEFLGPAEPSLPQATYRVVHAVLGSFELFLVPVARDADGTTYEAAFA